MRPLPKFRTLEEVKGRVVLDKDLEAGFEWNMNTSQLPTGIYALWVLDTQGVPLHRQKLVIVH